MPGMKVPNISVNTDRLLQPLGVTEVKAKPSDLLVQEPVAYRLSVNLTAAKALGLAIPESILSRADEIVK